MSEFDGVQPGFVDNGYSDIEIHCPECNKTFTWTAGEQEFYYERGLLAPKYCKLCRAARRAKFQRMKGERHE